MDLSRIRKNEIEAQEKVDALLQERDRLSILVSDAVQEYERARSEFGMIEQKTLLMKKQVQELQRAYEELEGNLEELEHDEEEIIADLHLLEETRQFVNDEVEQAKKEAIYFTSNARLAQREYENTLNGLSTQESELKAEIGLLNTKKAELIGETAQLADVIDMHATNMKADKDLIEQEWARLRERTEKVERQSSDTRKLRVRLKKTADKKNIKFPINTRI